MVSRAGHAHPLSAPHPRFPYGSSFPRLKCLILPTATGHSDAAIPNLSFLHTLGALLVTNRCKLLLILKSHWFEIAARIPLPLATQNISRCGRPLSANELFLKSVETALAALCLYDCEDLGIRDHVHNVSPKSRNN